MHPLMHNHKHSFLSVQQKKLQNVQFGEKWLLIRLFTWLYQRRPNIEMMMVWNHWACAPLIFFALIFHNLDGPLQMPPPSQCLSPSFPIFLSLSPPASVLSAWKHGSLELHQCNARSICIWNQKDPHPLASTKRRGVDFWSAGGSPLSMKILFQKATVWLMFSKLKSLDIKQWGERRD